MTKVLLIDYENVQGMDLSRMKQLDCKVYVFTGSLQNKIPIELVTTAQALGNKLEWVRIEGTGPNALDFHIAYYLGVLIAKDHANEYMVLSRDKGFDPLLKHLAKEKVICKRITSISEIELKPAQPQKGHQRPVPPSLAKRTREQGGDYGKVVANLQRIDKIKRPRNVKTLRKYLRTLVAKPQTEEKLDQIVAQLVESELTIEANGRLIYKT